MPAETNYTLEIWGRLWSGAQSVYSYTLSPTEADELMTLGNASQHADDFASVFDWRLVRATHDFSRNGALWRRIDTYKTVRGFRAGMTPRRFYRLANGE